MKSQFLKNSLLNRRPLFLQILIQSGIALIGLTFSAYVYRVLDIYFGSVTIATVTLIALCGGIISSLVFSVIVTLLADFFFIAPVGSVLDNAQGVEHLLVVTTVSAIVSLFIQWVKAAYAELDIAREKSEITKSTMENFLAIVSHDVRNPLATIKMSAEMILRVKDKADAQANLANRIVRTVERADQMIQSLLDLSRLKAGQLIPLEFESCDLRGVIARTIEDLAFRYKDTGKIESDVASGEVLGNWSREGMRRALENLVNNAFKYGEPGTPVRVELRTFSDHVTLSVHNRGEPIAEAAMGKLFDAFQRATTTAEGWGIGLAVVKSVVDSHGGVVKVESSRKKGTSFTLDLPIRQASEGVTPRSLRTVLPISQSVGSKKTL